MKRLSALLIPALAWCGVSLATPAAAATLTSNPSAVDFGIVSVGGSVEEKVQIKKSGGSVKIADNGVSLGGANPGQFAIAENNCVDAEGIGESLGGPCNVFVACAPTSAGMWSATLNVAHEGADLPNPLVIELTCEGQDLCGDGNVDDGEECDDGELNSDTEPDACRTNCQEASCGDGVVDLGGPPANDDEECDSGGDTVCCEACLVINDGGACDESDCATGGTCDTGACTGTSNEPEGTVCDDGNAGTVDDVCDGAGNCAGVSPEVAEGGDDGCSLNMLATQGSNAALFLLFGSAAAALGISRRRR